MTNQQIEKAKNDYAQSIIDSFGRSGVPSGISDIRSMIADGFKAGASFALGKQEKDADAVIQGWVARDQDGNLPLFVGSKPYKQEGMDYWSVPHGRSLEYLNLNPALFPDLTWDSDPEPVEIILKRKKK